MSVMHLIMADKQLIGLIDSADVAAAVKVPRPDEFGTEALDILELELRSASEFSVGSDDSVPVTWPADTPFIIKVRKVCEKDSAEISDTWIEGTDDIAVIAHVRNSAYNDLG